MNSDSLTSLIPVIYYDLIARVASGAPFALLAASELQLQVWENGLLLTLLVFGGGYIIGSLLTTVSCLHVFVWRSWAIRKVNLALKLDHPLPEKPAEAFAELYRRIDFVTERNRYEGSVLEKMEAGAAFAENLLSGVVVCWILQALGWIDGPYWSGYLVGVLFLLATALLRRILLIVRQDKIYSRLNEVRLKGSQKAPHVAPSEG